MREELKRLFGKYQRALVFLANTPFGHHVDKISSFSGLGQNKIRGVFPNGLAIGNDERGTSFFRCKDFLSPTFGPALSSIETFNDWLIERKRQAVSSEKALAHFLGIERQPSLPQIMFASTEFFASAGDGNCYCDNPGAGTAWGTIRGLGTSTSAASVGTIDVAASVYRYPGGTTYAIQRGFLPFDTSSLALGNQISAGTLSLYAQTVTDSDNDANAYITVVQTTQASTGTLTTDDYDQVGTVSGSGTVDISTIGTAAYTTFALNATGLGWIVNEGTTKLGIREGHDLDNIAPDVNDWTRMANIRSSEYTGTASDPYLTLIYSPGGFLSTNTKRW